MWRAESFEKTLMLGKIEGRRRRGRQRMYGWMASPTQWTWVWVDSGSWWWTGRTGVLWFMVSQSQTRLSDWTDWLTDTHTHTHTRVYIYTHTHTYIHIYMYICIHIHICICMHIHIHTYIYIYIYHSLSSVMQSCPTLSKPMDCSIPGFPAHHLLQEPAQTHIHRVLDAIQPSHPLLSPSPPALNLSQHQDHFMSQLFTSDGQITGASASASVLPVNIQDWFPLGWTGWIFLQSKGRSRVFSNTTVQKHQFFSTQLSL